MGKSRGGFLGAIIGLTGLTSAGAAQAQNFFRNDHGAHALVGDLVYNFGRSMNLRPMHAFSACAMAGLFKEARDSRGFGHVEASDVLATVSPCVFRLLTENGTPLVGILEAPRRAVSRDAVASEYARVYGPLGGGISFGGSQVAAPRPEDGQVSTSLSIGGGPRFGDGRFGVQFN